MASSLFQQLTGQNQINDIVASPRIQNIKKIVNAVKMAQNPQLALNNLISQNPNMQQAVEYVKANGNDPKVAFFNLAKDKGLDPNQILNSLK